MSQILDNLLTLDWFSLLNSAKQGFLRKMICCFAFKTHTVQVTVKIFVFKFVYFYFKHYCQVQWYYASTFIEGLLKDQVNIFYIKLVSNSSIENQNDLINLILANINTLKKLIQNGQAIFIIFILYYTIVCV